MWKDHTCREVTRTGGHTCGVHMSTGVLCARESHVWDVTCVRESYV